MPAQRVILPITLSYTDEQMARIRQGFVPWVEEQKWFIYFSRGVLHLHRSWTGYCIYKVKFRRAGAGWMAYEALVNRDGEQYLNTDDAEDRELIAELIKGWLLDPAASEYHPSGFEQAMAQAQQPGYLGSPTVVSALIAQHFDYLLEHLLPEENAQQRLANYNALQDNSSRLLKIFSGEDPAYTPLPGGWHSVDELGAILVKTFGLNAEYCADESLQFIVDEALAALCNHLRAFIKVSVESEPPPTQDQVEEQMNALLFFVISVFLGTHTIDFAGKTLGDFHWRSQPAPVAHPPGPHPRLRPDGTPIWIDCPSTPTPLTAWTNPATAATVVPDGPMPPAVGTTPIAPPALPATAVAWEALAACGPAFVEPSFPSKSGLKPAAGVAIEETDGRVWLVSPTNGFGGYTTTLPKGRVKKGVSARATAVRAALEEAGLLIELTGHLMDCARSTTMTRYYRARRVGGSPAAMSWETQAVHLVPRGLLADYLASANDKPLLEALVDS